MHGIIWFHAWNHMIPCVELHGRSVGHGSMHVTVWNHTDQVFSKRLSLEILYKLWLPKAISDNFTAAAFTTVFV